MKSPAAEKEHQSQRLPAVPADVEQHTCPASQQHPPPELPALQLAAGTKAAPSPPAHTQGNPPRGSQLCHSHRQRDERVEESTSRRFFSSTCLARITLAPLHHIHASTLSTAPPNTEQQRAGSCNISTATGAATARLSPTSHPCDKRERLPRHTAPCCSQPDGKPSLTAAARTLLSKEHCPSSSPPQASQGL